MKDSRQPEGLLARLQVCLASLRVEEGHAFAGEATVTNIGTAAWLPPSIGPSTGGVGVVTFRCQLLDARGDLADRDYFQCFLTPGDGRTVLPGESVRFDIEIPPPPAGRYTLKFDLVSEGVTWFEANGSDVVRLPVQVGPLEEMVASGPPAGQAVIPEPSLPRREGLASKIRAALRSRSEGQRAPVSAAPSALPQQMISVRELIKHTTVEDCCARAEKLFAETTSWDYYLQKPFWSLSETGALLQRFGRLMGGLDLRAGMTVLDFGAGSCWTSRWLTQAGLRVIALDVSKTALEMGRELYRRQPILGNKPEPQFLLFDGHRIELPDESVDRIVCFDAFHHVPNPDEVLRELARVLKPGGLAGFCEPGPNHSKSPQSQYEMRHYGVIENDVVMADVWRIARRVGFAALELEIQSLPHRVSLGEFEDFLRGDRQQVLRFGEAARTAVREQRVFYLRKRGEPEPPDSRQREGLRASLQVEFASSSVSEGEPFRARATIRNTGTAIWLPRSAGAGAVCLGCKLFTRQGELIEIDYGRYLLTPGDGTPVLPEQALALDFEVPSPPRGHYLLAFDLVSEGVCWFEVNGSEVAWVPVEVE
jgi:ubiquinone/menaquinone biosynthesis C-methylase UbiE